MVATNRQCTNCTDDCAADNSLSKHLLTWTTHTLSSILPDIFRTPNEDHSQHPSQAKCGVANSIFHSCLCLLVPMGQATVSFQRHYQGDINAYTNNTCPNFNARWRYHKTPVSTSQHPERQNVLDGVTLLADLCSFYSILFITLTFQVICIQMTICRRN